MRHMSGSGVPQPMSCHCQVAGLPPAMSYEAEAHSSLDMELSGWLGPQFFQLLASGGMEVLSIQSKFLGVAALRPIQ